MRRGADLNAPADHVGGVGGQTPIFHAIHGNFATLQLLAGSSASPLDLSVRATFRRHGEIQSAPVTALEFAEQSGASTETLALLHMVSAKKSEK